MPQRADLQAWRVTSQKWFRILMIRILIWASGFQLQFYVKKTVKSQFSMLFELTGRFNSTRQKLVSSKFKSFVCFNSAIKRKLESESLIYRILKLMELQHRLFTTSGQTCDSIFTRCYSPDSSKPDFSGYLWSC